MDPLGPDEIRRQLAVHAQRLAAAGVEWLAPAALPSSPGAEAPPAERERISPPPPSSEPPDTAITESLSQKSIVRAATVRERGDTLQKPLPDGRGSDRTTPSETNPELSIAQRGEALQQLAAEVRGCTRCAALCSTRTQTVFGDGVPGVELCFVGEAPGEDEDRQGLPFVGAAGQLLNRIIAACGLRRDEVYIMNVLKCRPPGNRTPLSNEAANCRDFFDRQLTLVQPKFICALGGAATANLLQTTQSIGRLRGRFHDYRGIPVLVTYHPSFLLPHRSPERKRDVWDDMKLLLQRMGRPIPARARE